MKIRLKKLTQTILLPWKKVHKRAKFTSRTIIAYLSDPTNIVAGIPTFGVSLARVFITSLMQAGEIEETVIILINLDS